MHWLQRRINSTSASWAVVLLLVLGGGLVVRLVAGSGFPVLGFLVPLVLVAPLLLIQRIELGLIALVFATYIGLPRVLASHYGVGSTNLILLVGIVLALVVRAVLYDERPPGLGRPLALAFPFLAASVLSIVNASYLVEAREGVVELTRAVTTMLLVVALIRTGSHLRLAVWALLGAGLLVSAATTYQQLSGDFGNDFFGFAMVDAAPPGVRARPFRIAGPIGDPNFYAMVLVVLVPLAFERMVNGRWVFKLIAGATFSCCVLSILFTYSRGGMLALAAVALMLVVRWRPKLWLCGVAGLVLAVSLFFASKDFLERVQTIPAAAAELFQPGQIENSSARGRVSEWLVALEMMREKPVLGIGLNNYPPRYLDYSIRMGLDSRLVNRSAHSLYLEAGAETGLLGLGAFLFLVGYVLWRLWRSTQELDALEAPRYADVTWALLAALIGFFTASLFLHKAFPGYMWLFLGLGFAAIRLAALSPTSAEMSSVDPTRG